MHSFKEGFSMLEASYLHMRIVTMVNCTSMSVKISISDTPYRTQFNQFKDEFVTKVWICNEWHSAVCLIPSLRHDTCWCAKWSTEQTQQANVVFSSESWQHESIQKCPICPICNTDILQLAWWLYDFLAALKSIFNLWSFEGFCFIFWVFAFFLQFHFDI